MGDPRRADGALPPQTFDPQTAHPLVPENDDDFELPITVEEDVDFRPTGMLTETSAETPVDVNVKERTEKSTPHSLPAIQDFTLASPGLDRHAHEVAITRHEALTQPTTLTSPGGSTPTSKENDHREKLLAARAHLQSTRETTTPPTAVVPPPNKVESTKDSQHAHGQLRSFDIDDVDLDSMIEKIPNAEHVTGKDGTISAIPKEKPPKTTRTRVETSPLLVRVVLPSAQKNHDIFAQAPNWGSAIADTKINTTSPTPHTEPAPTNKGNKGRVESGVSLDVQPPREAIPATKTIIIDQNIGITPDTQKNTAINESGDVNKAIAAPDSTVNNTTKVPATPPHKETLLKRIGKWTAKLAVVALAVFSTHQPKDRHGDAEHAEPEMTQTNTIETPPTTDEMIFDVSEVDSYDTTSTHETTTPPTTDDSMVFEPSEVEYYGTTPNEPPVQATQDLLDNAIDQDTTTSTLTQMIHETLAQTLGTQTAQDVMLRTHNAIERYNESVHSGRWSDALTSRGEIINTIRDIQEQTLSPSTLTPERELLPIEAILDTQYIGHGEGQSGTVWEALAHVGELPLRHADGTPYWSDERAFHSWRNAQLTEMNNPRLVHSGDRIETYIDSQDNLHARLIRSGGYRASLASLPSEHDIEEVFAQISPNTQIETHVPTTTTPDLEDGDEVEEDTDTIVVAGQTITEGGVIEILSRNGNTVRYRVLDIIQGDGSPNRITLQSIDGRNLKTYKDIRSLEQNPSQFRVITR